MIPYFLCLMCSQLTLWMCARHGRACLDGLVSNLQPTLDSFARKLTRHVKPITKLPSTHPQPQARQERSHLINSLIEIRCRSLPWPGIWPALK
ncbi:uncharacterized protein BO80DRAFT_44178 [Aspergillus ibericus CBS 121593]|uniref:Secreted protein n=1 Tax=Aspergillus ibericus CBS 121593 TaxID=1448316 RepID=A0A395H323_9EURO|nr:hypothetical protein BO80DRAFT_44178 [Aspergillus ibericus CBS 121593]RAL01819.1 hypothetical protein BO80DRAFT_44178 [Aspergillus ibericus CBS 121593]